jgi:hypothetical protein
VIRLWYLLFSPKLFGLHLVVNGGC